MHVALTGGSTGIGAAVAARLKREGARVTTFDLNEPQQNSDHWIKVDMGDEQSIMTALKAADSPFDALINNAGVPPREGHSEQVLTVNYVGLRQFMDGMISKLSDGASIVNTASRAGAMWLENIEEVRELMALRDAADVSAFVTKHGIDHVRAYNLSKEAVIVLTMSMAEGLLPHNIRINSVSPAAVSTSILDDFKDAFGERVAKAITRVGRAGTPEEVADVICFLISPQSGWINGQNITVDGGLSAMVTSDELLR